MRYIIEVGDRFKCIKTFKMDWGEKAYIRGKEYVSEAKNCITDEQPDMYHDMRDLEDFFEYFKLIVK